MIRKGLIQPQLGSTGYATDMDQNLVVLDTNVVFVGDFEKLHVVATDGGNFTVLHGLVDATGNPMTPHAAFIVATSLGIIAFQYPVDYDNLNLYLMASDGGVSANILMM